MERVSLLLLLHLYVLLSFISRSGALLRLGIGPLRGVQVYSRVPSVVTCAQVRGWCVFGLSARVYIPLSADPQAHKYVRDLVKHEALFTLVSAFRTSSGVSKDDFSPP